MKNKKPLSLIIILVLALAYALFSGQLDLTGNKAQEPLSQPGIVLPSGAIGTDNAAPGPTVITARASDAPESTLAPIDENGSFTKAGDVALYLFTYSKLPGNFITKAQARDLGWPGGDLRPYAPGKAIGGDRFGNYEGLLPEKKGRTYYEADIDTLGKSSRGAKRLVYSNDGLVFYTDDHYESFTQLFMEDVNAQR